jgi:adenosylmethionine---8-amino-7-oxononanoate aminotransferase
MNYNYHDIDRLSLWHPYTKQSFITREQFPIITKASGIYLYDNDNNRYFDAVSSWWASNLGHCHPKITAAIKKQAETLDHSILGNMSHPFAINLAEKIAKLMPKDNYYSFFASDGASAVEAALKIALQYWYIKKQPQRNNFLSLNGNYHGDTLGAVSIGFLPDFHAPFAHAVRPSLKAEAPYCKNCIEKDSNSCSLSCFSAAEQVITTHSEQIAAMIVEPLCQCAGGMCIYKPEYLKKLAELCQKHGILLIADEIAVGFGRTGKMFAFEHANIIPDIICLGKGLAGGHLPMSATIVKKNIYQSFNDAIDDCTFYHGHTFAGNPICAAAALATLQIYTEEKIVQQAERKGKILQNAVAELKTIPQIKNIRGLGMIAAFDVESSAFAHKIKAALMSKGVMLRPLGNTLYLMPPLITPDKVLLETVALIKETFEIIGHIAS